MILNVDPGGCGPVVASPLIASTAPSRGRTTAIPPSRSPSAETAARWRPGRIVARTERPRFAFVEAMRRLPNSEHRARPPAEPLVVGALEPGARLVAGRRIAGDRRRRRLAVEPPPVGGEHRGAPRRRADRAPHALAGAQAGQPQVGAPAHADALAHARDRQRHPPAQRPEQPRAHRDRHGHAAVLLLADLADGDAAHGRLVVGHPVVGRESPRRVLRLRVGVEPAVHLRRLALLPRGREAHRRVAQLLVLLVALVEHVRRRAAGGQQQHEDDQRQERQPPPAAAPRLDPAHAAAA